MRKVLFPTTNFEKNNEPLASGSKFFFRMLQSAMYCLVVLAFSLAIGTWGYHVFAQTAWVDSFLNASMILTGMGPVDKMESDSAKFFPLFTRSTAGSLFYRPSLYFLHR